MAHERREQFIEAARVEPGGVDILLTDGRRVLVPFDRIPGLGNATFQARAACRVAAGRTAVVWSPEMSGVDARVDLGDLDLSPH